MTHENCKIVRPGTAVSCPYRRCRLWRISRDGERYCCAGHKREEERLRKIDRAAARERESMK